MLAKTFVLLVFFVILGESRYGSHSKENFGPPTTIFPSFLKNASVAEKKDFFTIITNTTATKGEKKSEIEKWAKKIGGNVEILYNDYEANLTKFKTENRGNISRILAELPARLADFYKIVDDETVTEKEELVNVKNFFDKITDQQLKAALELIVLPRFGPRAPPAPKMRWFPSKKSRRH